MKQVINKTLVDILNMHAEDRGNKAAYHILDDEANIIKSISYNGILRDGSIIAEYLIQNSKIGDRIVLMYDNSIDFIVAFFGCLLSARVPVPVYPPMNRESSERLKYIYQNCEAKLILSHPKVLSYLKQLNIVNTLSTISAESDREQSSAQECGVSTMLNGISIIDSTQLKQSLNQPLPTVNEDTVAFIQYTSGSTTSPKGVIVTHRNIMANLKVIQSEMLVTPESIIATWCPVSHDMGLIGLILEPIYSGVPCYIITPMQFIKNPLLWLKIVSKYKITTTGGPNFSYDLCVKSAPKITPEDAIDLSTLGVLFNGSEPIHMDSLHRFADTFKKYGFSINSFYPCYGLAESTLFVCGKGNENDKVNTILVDSEELSAHKVKILTDDEKRESKPSKLLVSCGTINKDIDVVLLNHETNQYCKQDEVGQILIAGESISKGYWGQDNTHNDKFITLQGKQYLNTGDLGFIHSNELYICGRLKDIVIINGKNYYPQDIEKLITSLSPYCYENGTIAFGVDTQDGENIVVVVGVKTKNNNHLIEIKEKIYRAILLNYQIKVSDIIFVSPKEIPKTTSGKPKRAICKTWYMNKQFNNLLTQ